MGRAQTKLAMVGMGLRVKKKHIVVAFRIKFTDPMDSGEELNRGA